MRIEIDRDLCTSSGQCEFAAPDVFSIDDAGDLQILDASPPESEWADVERAVRACPTSALSLSD